jgi:hypothetical protein
MLQTQHLPLLGAGREFAEKSSAPFSSVPPKIWIGYFAFARPNTLPLNDRECAALIMARRIFIRYAVFVSRMISPPPLLSGLI